MNENEEFEFRLRMEREQKQAPVRAAAPKYEPAMGEKISQGALNIGTGLLRGAGSIGATLAYPVDKITDLVQGDREQTLEGLVAGKAKPLSRNEERRARLDENMSSIGAETDSYSYMGGKLAGEIAGTAGAGGLLGQGVSRAAPVLARVGVSAPATANLASALTTSGMRAGTATGAGGMALRMAGGAAAGGLGAGMIDPQSAGTGAALGAALPPALAGLGKVGRAVGAKLAGPAAAPEVRQAVQNARDVGYVIPPTQAKPTLVNRALEGFSGKITTAQNASAKNQPITNELARKAIGAADLSEAGIAQVRAQANQAYDALGQVGKFQADAGFAQALDNAASTTAAMRQNFPELINSEVDDLVAGLKSRPEFEAQPTIEAIKQFRANAATNKAALDPGKKALGRAQTKIAGALEDLIDRNLQASGNPQLLNEYRAARQTLAKTYDVEKALNRATGNVDGNKLAQMMQKGKPMTGDLRKIAEFAARFPKANQMPEKMGSLPGLSPLDFGALGGASAITGNPLLMAGVVARPLARAATLSGPVQNRLATAPAGPGALNRLYNSPGAQQLIYRSVPAIADGGAR